MAQAQGPTQEERFTKLERDLRVKFYDALSKPSQILKWHDMKVRYEKTEAESESKASPTCEVCSRIFKLVRGVAGIGTRFYRDEDGSYVAECGGRNDAPVCPGLRIVPDAYVDQATVTQELHQASSLLLRELKHIRDRVLALETITKDDERMFDELTEEYRAIRQLEEEHYRAIETQPYAGAIYSYEEGPGTELQQAASALAGEAEIFRSPMIFKQAKGGAMKPLETRDLVSVAICKEDLPVLISEVNIS
jgi:hypothetical protein